MSVAALPFAFLFGLLRTRYSHAGALTDLVARLGATERSSLCDALRDALGDPSLSLAYWLPESGRYVDAAGSPV